MFQLKKMAETVARKGIFDTTVSARSINSSGLFEPERVNAEVYSDTHQRALYSRFVALLANAHPFIFHLSAGDTVLEANDSSEQRLSLPFKTCSFEVSNGRNLTQLTKPSDTEYMPEDVFCVLIHEVTPYQYEIFFHSQMGEHEGVSYCESQSGIPNGVLETVDRYIAFLNSERRMGEEGLPYKLKVPSVVDKGATYVPIQTIIHITDKALTSRAFAITGGEIHWRHRWMVRGHWRAIAGLGKDREGVYGVSGQTWVTEHLKGPEELPVVKKVRLVGEPPST